MSTYDPFAPGPFRVDVRTIQQRDAARHRTFSCEIWSPAEAARKSPLVLFSHPAGQGRRSATFLCAHLASHGYVVAAMDHSEVVVPELARPDSETEEQRSARFEAIIASRVPDLRFILDHLLTRPDLRSIDDSRIGLVGHSFGGWTVLAAPDAEARVHSIVALAPAGAPRPKPGILPVTLAFKWGRSIPTLYLVAEDDTSLPIEGMYELFGRTPGADRMVILRRADHLHFMDDAERLHESFRTMPAASAELAALQKEMRPIGELHSGEQAHLFARGLTLAHLDATMRHLPSAREFLRGDLENELGSRGIEIAVHFRGVHDS